MMELNKVKYLYSVHKESDGMHCERFPVVYANKTFFYYKVPGSDYLRTAQVGAVREKFENKHYKLLLGRYASLMFFDASEFDKDVASSEMARLLKEEKRRNIDENIAALQKSLDAQKKALEEVE